jgi:predicted nuclease of predicted toxin-antitoxin system
MAARYLVDANISPRVCARLRAELEIDVAHVSELGLLSAKDHEIASVAEREGYVVLTHDVHFGEVYHRSREARFGVVILRVEDQSTGHVARVLERFLKSAVEHVDLEHALVVVHEHALRIVTEPFGTSRSEPLPPAHDAHST